MGFTDSILQYSENHPYVLLALVVALVIIIFGMFISCGNYSIPLIGKKSKEKSSDGSDIDRLIHSIRKKQSKNKGGQS